MTTDEPCLSPPVEVPDRADHRRLEPDREASALIHRPTAFVIIGLLGILHPAIGGADDAARPTACAATPLPPATMTYRLIEDGRERGTADAILRPTEDGTWLYRVTTRGRAGIIRVTAIEESAFDWHDGKPRSLRYRRELKAGPFRRRSTASFDWERGLATGVHRGDDWELPIEPGMVDRLLLQLVSASRIAAGAEAIQLTYIDRGRERELDAPRLPRGELPQANGEVWPIIRVDRVRGTRVTSTFHGEAFGLLPVRVEHHDPDDDEHWSLELATIEWLPCPEARVESRP